MFTRHNTTRARDDIEGPPVAEVTHEKERQSPVDDSEAGANLPPSYTEVQEGDLPGYNTISEKTRNEVNFIYGWVWGW